MGDKFFIRVHLNVDRTQGFNEIKKKIAIIEKQLDGITVKIDGKKAGKELDTLTKKAKNYNEQNKKLTTNMNKTKQASKEGSKGFRILGQNVFEAAGKFIAWAGIAGVIYGAVNAVKSMVSNTIELETAMTEFEIVSDATDSQLNTVNSTVNELSMSLGALKTEVAGAATEFARAGFSIQESMSLAESSIIGARVGFASMDNVSKTLVATIRAFNLEASDSSNIVNDLFVASKTAAITFEGLGEALTRSANSMNLAKASFEETIGLISAANETVQDAAKVGSALKTISSRLRGIDEANNLPKLTRLMSEFGVEIENGAGGFRNIYDIMNDLAGAFSNSSDEFRKQLVLEELAGKYSCSQLKNISLIQRNSHYETILSQAV